MRIDASGNVGVGVSPEAWNTYTPLQVQLASLSGYTNGDSRLSNNAYYAGGWKYINSIPATQYLMDAANGIHTWSTAASGTADATITWQERMRIDSAGRVGIGVTNPNAYYAENLVVAAADEGGITIVSDPAHHAYLMFADGTSGSQQYRGYISYDHGTDNMNVISSGTLRFYTDDPSTEAARIDSSNVFLVGATSSTLGGSVAKRVGVSGSHDDGSQTMTVYNSSTSCGNNGILLVGTARTANGTFDLFNCWTAGVGDKEFKVRGDGNVFADGTFSGGGADYAEFFEWLDGNSSAEDRRGYSVVLEGGKIRAATSEDDASQIIGVISANPAMIGDNDMERWRGKYLRDDFGAYDLDENGDKQLNPDYDETQTYVSRENRVEWDIVGLMGKLRIREGQPTGSNWIKIKDISAGIEEWLVR
jgi:hypothetical protein